MFLYACAAPSPPPFCVGCLPLPPVPHHPRQGVDCQLSPDTFWVLHGHPLDIMSAGTFSISYYFPGPIQVPLSLFLAPRSLLVCCPHSSYPENRSFFHSKSPLLNVPFKPVPHPFLPTCHQSILFSWNQAHHYLRITWAAGTPPSSTHRGCGLHSLEGKGPRGSGQLWRKDCFDFKTMVLK